MIATPPPEPESSYCRLMHHAARASEAATDLPPAELRRLASGWSAERLARAVDQISTAALGLEETAEVLERLRERRARQPEPRPLKGGLDRPG